MNEVVSVVVPVYNVELYLSKCIDSILSQTYKKLDIILVDDGSTDSSPLLCEKYSKLDARIRVIHKLNGGLSDARNAGLEIARGKYICFIDSDDWIEKDIIEKALAKAIELSCKVVVWGYSKDFVNQNDDIIRNEIVSQNNCEISTKKNNFSVLSQDVTLALIGYAWNKLYDTKLIKDNQLSFQKGVSLVEDILFNSPTLVCAQSFCFLNLIGSHYIQRNRETLGAKFYPNYYDLKLQACHAREKVLIAYGFDNQQVRNVMMENYFSAIKSSCRMAVKSSELSNKEKKIYMKQLCKTESAKKIIKEYKAHGKNIFFKLALLFGQVWVFRVLYQ